MKSHWDVKVLAENIDEAREVVSNIERVLGFAIQSPRIQAYWKLEGTYEVRFELHGPAKDGDAAVSELEKMCDLIGSGWTDDSPHVYPDGILEWSRVIDSRTADIYISQVSWIHCWY